MADRWQRLRGGLYIHPELGGIQREAPTVCWYWYPAGKLRRVGPHITLRSAKETAQQKGLDG